MMEINLYKEMNDQIADILRIGEEPTGLYAAAYIDHLRLELARLREDARWREAERELPDIGEVVWCRIEHNCIDDGWSAYRKCEHGGEGHWVTLGNLYAVTHWRPMPKWSHGEGGKDTE
jgi:hypothetical protein